MSSLPVFLAERPLPAHGERLRLDGAEGRHAARARRIRVGEEVLVTDGSGQLARCAVREVGPDALELDVRTRCQRSPPALRVTLAQALLGRSQAELAVELATEAGVDAILPWRAERCVARWDDAPRTAKALSRWRSTAQQSAKQARRAIVPEVGEPVDTPALSGWCRWAAPALVLHEAAEATLATVRLPQRGELVLVTGPEGGITEAELAELVAAGAQPVRLGPEVLRASTAGAVALGALGALSSRWNGPMDASDPPRALPSG